MTEVTPSDATSGFSGPPSALSIAVEDGRMADAIIARLEGEERIRARVIDDPRTLLEPEGRPSPAPGLVIVSHHVIRQLAKTDPGALADFCDSHTVVLLIRSQEFLDSIGYLEFAGGVIFLDATIDRLRDIVALAGAGYSILPSAAVMDIVTDRLRCDSIGRLSLIELNILDQVRLAKTNRAIARSLGLTEANVKTKVRAILKALKFQNRTEAAVFAARQSETIRAALARRGQDSQAEPEVDLDDEEEVKH